MSMLGTQQPTEYDEVTKQSFKDETNVNKILARHMRMGTISHLQQWGGQYGDLAGFNFQEAQNQIAKANSMFEKLPSSVRNEFSNSPERFFDYVNDPEHKDKLAQLLPALAKSGRQLALEPTPEPPPAAPEPVTP